MVSKTTQPCYLSTAEAAKLTGCCETALKNAVADGRLKCIKPVRSRWRLFEVSDLNLFLQNRPEWHQPKPGHVQWIDPETLQVSVIPRSELNHQTAELTA